MLVPQINPRICSDMDKLFPEDIKKNWAQISKEKGNPGNTPKEASKRAYEIYCNTVQSPLPFIILGLNRIREDEFYKRNFGLVTNNPKKKSLKSESLGSILGESQWSTLINDSFILGAINSKKEVFLVIDSLPTTAQLWNQGKLTTFGRELAILCIAGYKRSKTLGNEIAFQHFPNDLPSQSLKLNEIWKKIAAIKPNDLQDFIEVIDC